MKRYILTGGIGAGKSAVSELFAQHGAYCLDLDELGHSVLRKPSVISALVDVFGEGIVAEDGSVSRPALAALAFASAEATAKLNAITHPHILQSMHECLENAEALGSKLAIIEAAAFDGPDGVFAPLAAECDGIIAVLAPEELRVQRAMARGFSEADVWARMEVQSSDEERASWANYVLDNSGSLDNLRARVGVLAGMLA